MTGFRSKLAVLTDIFLLPKTLSQPLTRFDLIRIKNWMLAGIYLANGAAYILMENLIFNSGPLPSKASKQAISAFGTGFRIFFVGFGILAFALIYEEPMRRMLNNIYHRRPTSPKTAETARRRLLNEPFYAMFLNLMIWITAAFFFGYLFKRQGEPHSVVIRLILISLNTGLVTAIMSFFILEHISQQHVSRFFFPEGGLYRTPKTIRIRIVVRFIALLIACNIIPLLSFIQLAWLSEPGSQDTGAVLQSLRTAIITNAVFFIMVGVSVTQFVITNFAVPIKEIIETLKDIRKGNFDRRVCVRSNDEIGYTGDVINEMTSGLKERDRMRQSLFLARQVQQSLLPAENPHIKNLDIAGSSIYCDETDGDYYDFIKGNGNEDSPIGIAIGDVSGHGISSALLMAAVRSSLRQRSSLPGSAADIIADVNHQLFGDMEASGQFVTLFYLRLDPSASHLEYVRAGHDPAIFYDPDTDTFEPLEGPGIALGVDKDWPFHLQTRTGLKSGQIIFLGTDGIWEARNPQGEMFGKHPLHDIIRQHARSSARAILDATLDSLNHFLQNAKIEDDITLVVVKITP